MDDEGRLPIERELRRRLEDLGREARTELLRLLDLSGKERAAEIKARYEDPRQKTMAELLIDLEEDPGARAIVVGELRIMDRQDG